ncbi:MAG: peptide-methionine (R)-S-oxide reductase [Methyloceanibacter sp.]
MSPEQYRVTQQNGTEHPGTGEYLDNKKPGIHVENRCGHRSLRLRRNVRHLFSGPCIFFAHDVAAFAVAPAGADHRQLDAPPAASLRHDLTGIGPLKTGDRPVPRRGRVAITLQRPFVVS